MQTLMRRAFVAAGLYMIVAATSAWAQQAQPVRIRGEITKVDGNTLSIKSRDGQNLTVKLADNARIAAPWHVHIENYELEYRVDVNNLDHIAAKTLQLREILGNLG